MLYVLRNLILAAREFAAAPHRTARRCSRDWKFPDTEFPGIGNCGCACYIGRMKKRVAILLLAALGICFARAAEKPAEVDFKLLGYENELFTLDGKPFTGAAVKKDKQGRVRGHYDYAAGKLSGTIEEWYTNGVKSAQTSFADGRRDGTNTYWNLDGSLLKRQVWRDGKLTDSTEKHDLETPAP